MTPVSARRCRTAALTTLAATLPSLTFAHPGHGANDALAGLLHPFTGLDHLLAMFAVGVWAVRLGRLAVWTLPAVFPVAMIVGALLAVQGIVLPAIEPMIALSVMVLGLLVAMGMRMPTLASAVLVGLFAIFHGYAHASEAPASATMMPFALGFVAATIVLHLAGIAVGSWSERLARAGQGPMRILGSLIAAAGATFLIF